MHDHLSISHVVEFNLSVFPGYTLVKYATTCSNTHCYLFMWDIGDTHFYSALLFPQSRQFLYFFLQFNNATSLCTPWRFPITSDSLRKSSVLICGNLASCNLHTLAISRTAEMSTFYHIPQWPRKVEFHSSQVKPDKCCPWGIDMHNQWPSWVFIYVFFFFFFLAWDKISNYGIVLSIRCFLL